jgi:hypothetical protein
VGGLAVFQLLLQVSATVLVFAKVEKFAREFFDRDTCESID